MKIKSNYLLQFSIFFSFIFLALAPGICIMLLIIDSNIDKKELFNIIITFGSVPIWCFVVCSFINFIINLFIKPKLFLYEDEFKYKGSTYKYSDICEVEYDLGTVSKVSSKAAALVLYRKRGPGIVIKNPSIRMIYHIKKKCIGKPFKLENWLSFVIIGVIMLVVSVIFGIVNRG